MLELDRADESLGLFALSGSLRGGCRFLLGVCGDEVHARRGAVDPDQFAAPVGEPRRRQQQEEFLGPQHVERALDLDLRTALRYVEQNATAPPRAVRAHQIDRLLVIHFHALRFATVELHRLTTIFEPRSTGSRVLALAAISPHRTAHWLVDRSSVSKMRCARSRSAKESLFPPRLLRMVRVVCQFSREARHAMTSPSQSSSLTTRSMISSGAPESTDSAVNKLAVSPRIAKRFTVESLSLPMRLRTTISGLALA